MFACTMNVYSDPSLYNDIVNSDGPVLRAAYNQAFEPISVLPIL